MDSIEYKAPIVEALAEAIAPGAAAPIDVDANSSSTDNPMGPNSSDDEAAAPFRNLASLLDEWKEQPRPEPDTAAVTAE